MQSPLKAGTWRRVLKPRLSTALVAILIGSSLAVFNMMLWGSNQESIAVAARSSLVSGQIVAQFFLEEAVSLLMIGYGFFILGRQFRSSWRVEAGREEGVLSVVSAALSSRRDFKYGVIAALSYGVFLALISSTVVYQPSVDFSQVYGVTGPSWWPKVCCGQFGAVPAIVFYVAPQLHLAMQILPLGVLLLLVMPMLVGANISVATYSFRIRTLRGQGRSRGRGWLSTTGSAAGLFASCPSCASLFLASSFGGFGATALAVALAPYQLLFVSISIPLLVASPFLIARNVVSARNLSCITGLQNP